LAVATLPASAAARNSNGIYLTPKGRVVLTNLGQVQVHLFPCLIENIGASAIV
jgi:hypothetical protein